MFTGIIQEKGIIKKIKSTSPGKTLTITAPNSSKKLKKGDSLAVDGVCLTVTKKNKNEISFDIIEETLKKSRFQNIKNGDSLNLELPIRYGDFVSGHLLLGHIDGTGIVKKISKSNKNTAQIEIKFPHKLSKFIAQKGCIGINGISITVAKKKSRSFIIALTPFTGHNTNLSDLKKQDEVNLEIDLIARYLKNILKNIRQKT